ncbi:MAG: hypothetical protein AUJ57_01815 [Zetaproteobacteria bacterium CG1_02_53_45]|nr:MAG: hypothetical protein AUJ57_01815 [Zetaproteobacteria bacterium CG1_02_53_45]
MNGQVKRLADMIQLRFEEHVLPRYQQLERREQRVVLAAVVLLPLIILVFGLMLPLKDRQEQLRAELQTVRTQVAEAERLALYLTEHAVELKASGGASQNLLGTVEQLARQTNVRSFMTRIKPQPSLNSGEQQLMLSIRDVPYDAVMRFIYALASRNLGLNRLKFQATAAPGIIHVQAVITSG